MTDILSCICDRHDHKGTMIAKNSINSNFHSFHLAETDGKVSNKPGLPDGFLVPD